MKMFVLKETLTDLNQSIENYKKSEAELAGLKQRQAVLRKEVVMLRGKIEQAGRVAGSYATGLNPDIRETVYVQKKQNEALSKVAPIEEAIAQDELELESLPGQIEALELDTRTQRALLESYVSLEIGELKL